MSTWSMSDQSPQPVGSFRISDVVVATLASTGALHFAPRSLDCWIAREQIAVRSSSGELLWVEDTDPANIGPDAPSHLIDLPVPEVLAIRDLSSVCGWLGVTMPAAAAGISCEFLGRPTQRYEFRHPRYKSISIIEDDETGLVMEVQATSAEHGEQHLQVTRFSVVPWKSELFPPFEASPAGPLGDNGP